ncbi:MAG: V-type ATP synthase subunit C [Leptotrichia sp.]|jgi:ATP synthase, subunit C|uniref:V-type ATP synthase subunit C n=1 Tax=Leptotrichia rugosa TaxID=3239302 RepID=A0AB39VFL7_9FUSO|nr:V-type ATP synthase subunit C [Leptotrichia sp. oral taxon 498]ASQ48873.1 ATPase [Leptotrichia sp. oral taxon 498]RKW35870.1 MAG: V-type ATP synthase subunit C [Leptotrichia sp.]
MDRMDYGQSVVTIRVLEKRLLTKNRIERMIESETCEEVLKLLSETEYSQDMTDIQNSRDYEKILKRETERVFSLVRNMSKNKEVVDILSLKYDYHNLKVLIKSKVFEKDNTNLLMNAGTIDITKFKTKSETQSLDLPEEILEAIAEIKKEENLTPQKIDIIVEKYYFKNLVNLSKKIDVKVITDYVKGLIDFQNIITLFRVQKQNRDAKFLDSVIFEGGTISKDKIVASLNDSSETILNKFKKEKLGPYLVKGVEVFNETKRLSEFEKISDNYLMELNKESKYIVFGPEPLFTYLVAKEREINAIRLIMVSKINNISSEKIRERLRDTYA